MGAHAHHDHEHKVSVIPADKAKIKHIWVTCGWLGLLTGVEFVLAFTMGRGILLTSIFVILTFAKTFLIVGEFMHLKHETKALIWSIILPMSFVVWLITALCVEGNAILQLREWVK